MEATAAVELLNPRGLTPERHVDSTPDSHKLDERRAFLAGQGQLAKVDAGEDRPVFVALGVDENLLRFPDAGGHLRQGGLARATRDWGDQDLLVLVEEGGELGGQAVDGPGRVALA